MMRPNRPKPLCKFKQTCRNYKEGKECNFSHQKCSRGRDCQNIQTCMFFHQSVPSKQIKDFKKQSKFQKPKNEVQCKFGARCSKKLEGTCGFKHSEIAQNSQSSRIETKFFDKPQVNKAQILCNFGARCTAFPLGKCPYKHQTSQMTAERQQTNLPKKQNHKAIFQTLCIEFIYNFPCNQQCNRLHEYTETKSISKIFSIGGCQKYINKLMIMEPYQPDQQPLYIVLGNNRIAFTQLTNLAKQTGNQNIGNSALVMKRWFDKDLQFQGSVLEDFWVTKIDLNNQRVDVLVCKCNNGIKIVAFNREIYSDISENQEILSVISLSSNLFILLKSGKTVCLQFDFGQNGFLYLGEVFKEKFRLLKKFHKKIQDQQIAAVIMLDGTLCFINNQLQTHFVKLNQKVLDLTFTQFSNIPTLLVIVEQGKLYAVNLLTFESTLLLNAKLSEQSFQFTQLALTNNHLFICVNKFGVLVYSIQKFDKPIGVIALDNSTKWQLNNDLRGNLVLVGQSPEGRRDISIFKARKI